MNRKKTIIVVVSAAVVMLVIGAFVVYTPALPTAPPTYRVACTVAYSAEFSTMRVTNGTTIFGTSTGKGSTSYTTMTNVSASQGFVTHITGYQNTTITGAIAAGEESTCTYLSK